MKRLPMLAIMTILFLTSCATYSFVPIDAPNINLQRDRGTITPIFVDEQLGISVVPKIIKSYLSLQIVVRNNSVSDLYMADAFFNCYVSTDNNHWELIKRYSSKEFYKKEYDSYVAGAVLMAISAGLSSASAGYGNSRTTGSYYGSSSYGSVSGSYNSTTTYYDPTAAELARQRNQANIESYVSSGKRWLSFLESNLFYEKDLLPSEMYSGLVFYDFEPNTFLKVTVSIDEIEKAVFTYQIEKD